LLNRFLLFFRDRKIRDSYLVISLIQSDLLVLFKRHNRLIWLAVIKVGGISLRVCSSFIAAVDTYCALALEWRSNKMLEVGIKEESL